MSRKPKQVPCTEMDGGRWHYLHTDVSLIIQGDHPPIEPVPLDGPDRSWPPGTVFSYLGGHRMSACFRHCDFTKTNPVEYLGQIPEPEGAPLACFRQRDNPTLYAWHAGDCELYFGTAGLTARTIELDRATVEGETIPPPDKSQRGTVRPPTWPEWRFCPECWHMERGQLLEHRAAFPVKWPCPKCNATLDVSSSYFPQERAAFDQLEAHFGPKTGRVIPPPPAVTVAKKLSASQAKMLRNLHDFDDPCRGLRGNSEFGGAMGTMTSLRKLGLMGGEGHCTNLGKLVYFCLHPPH